MINTQIIVAVAIIGASGVIRVWTGQGSKGSSITRVLVGADVLLIVLAVIDLFGGPLSTLAGGIAMLAAFTVVLTQIPWSDLFARLGIGVLGKPATPKPSDTTATTVQK